MNDADAPYAISKVIGASYHRTIAEDGVSVSVSHRIISTGGGWIAIAVTESGSGSGSGYSYSNSFIADVTSYDPQTGVGVGVAYGEPATFYIRGTPGAMSLSYGE